MFNDFSKTRSNEFYVSMFLELHQQRLITSNCDHTNHNYSDEKAVDDQLAVSSPHLSTDESMIWRENLLQQQFVSPAQELRFKVSAIFVPQKHI